MNDAKPTIVGNEELPPSGHDVSIQEAFKVWLRVAALSFGGPAGQIAVMHRILVEEKHWISESRFLYALNYCMLLPGPEAQQLATYMGWLMHRTLGGLMAGGLFILPGVIAIMGLSWVYALYGQVGRGSPVLRIESSSFSPSFSKRFSDRPPRAQESGSSASPEQPSWGSSFSVSLFLSSSWPPP